MESYRHPHCNTPAEDVQESSCRLRQTLRLRTALTAAEEQHCTSGSSSLQRGLFTSNKRVGLQNQVASKDNAAFETRTSKRLDENLTGAKELTCCWGGRTNVRTVWMDIALSLWMALLFIPVWAPPICSLQMTFHFLLWLSHHVLIFCLLLIFSLSFFTLAD